MAIGLQRSGRITMSAALPLIIVFACFGTGQSARIDELGLTLGLAVSVDATVGRCFLVRATRSLLGDGNSVGGVSSDTLSRAAPGSTP